MKSEESNGINEMEIIAIRLYIWLSLRSPNFVSSLFVFNSSNGLSLFIACHFLQMRERICHLWLAQTVESHTLEKAGQDSDGKLC